MITTVKRSQIHSRSHKSEEKKTYPRATKRINVKVSPQRDTPEAMKLKIWMLILCLSSYNTHKQYLSLQRSSWSDMSFKIQLYFKRDAELCLKIEEAETKWIEILENVALSFSVIWTVINRNFCVWYLYVISFMNTNSFWNWAK